MSLPKLRTVIGASLIASAAIGGTILGTISAGAQPLQSAPQSSLSETNSPEPNPSAESEATQESNESEIGADAQVTDAPDTSDGQDENQPDLADPADAR